MSTAIDVRNAIATGAGFLLMLDGIVEKYIEAYKTDWTEYDRPWIEAHPGQPFIWIARASGSDLITECTPEDTTPSPFQGHPPWNYADSARTILEYHAREGDRNFFYYNGKTFKRIQPDNAVSIFNAHLLRKATA